MQISGVIAENAVRIDLAHGCVHALRDAGLLTARGIPYARAQRWGAPQPAAPGEIFATRPARACPQLSIPRLEATLPGAFAGLSFDESCQDLSVTAPENAHGLPVIVWLHGGSYESGAADMAVFDPSALVVQERVVFVAVSYRLGFFGWLSGDGRPANLGALDVIAALRWVNRNIAAFGGDPGRVTLLGQSSGGDLAVRLMIAEGARGLFQRVIVQSAPLSLPLGAGRMRKAMQRAAQGLADDAPTEALLERQAAIRRAARRFGLAGQMPFGPEFGAAPFPPESEHVARYAEIAPDIAVMIGHVRDEAALFLPPDPAAGRLRRVADPLRRMAVRALTRRLYARPAQEFAARQAKAGGQAARHVIDWGHGVLGAVHLADLPLIFPSDAWIGTPIVPPEMTLEALTRTGAPLRALWAGFARDGGVGMDAAGVIRILQRPGNAKTRAEARVSQSS